MSRRYRIVPGFVRSENDGDLHWIDAETLIRLYRVSRLDCVVGGPEVGGRWPDGLTWLRPDPTGQYNVYVQGAREKLDLHRAARSGDET